MTKEILDYAGEVAVMVRVESYGGFNSTERASAFTTSVSRNMKSTTQRAIMRCLAIHIFKFHAERLQNYHDYKALINNRVKNYEVLDYGIFYSGNVKIKRITIEGHYYTQVREGGKIKSTKRWTSGKEEDLNYYELAQDDL